MYIDIHLSLDVVSFPENNVTLKLTCSSSERERVHITKYLGTKDVLSTSYLDICMESITEELKKVFQSSSLPKET